MKCPNCYRELASNVDVCPSCGLSLHQQAQYRATPIDAQPSPATASSTAQSTSIAVPTTMPETEMTCIGCRRPLTPGETQYIRPPKRGLPASPICRSCITQVQAAFEYEARDADLTKAAIFGLAAAILAAAAWYGITIATGFQLGLIALGVGWLVGTAISYGAGRKRGRPLQVMSLGLTVIGLLAAKYLIFNYFMSNGNGIILPVDTFLVVYIEYLQAEPIDLLFFAIALYYTWHTLAVRTLKLL